MLFRSGVKILKVHEGIVFRSQGFIFKDFINDIYDKRKKSGKESVDNVLCKLIMNSTYGRFALRRDREKLVIDDGRCGLSLYSEHETNSGDYFRLMSEPSILDSSFAHVGIGAWVTSNARVLMHKLYMEAPESLWYTDTDSLFSTHNYSSNQDDLGKLKLEYSCDAACFLLPKTYIVNSTNPIWSLLNEQNKPVIDESGKPVKTSRKVVMKGFDRRKLNHFKIDRKSTRLNSSHT